MDSPHYQFKVSWYEQCPGLNPIHQSHRYRTEKQARDFVDFLKKQPQYTRVVIERREVTIGPWQRMNGGAA